MNKNFLYLIVFLAGAIVMVFELLGSRILSPYLGSSLSVWTSIIGLILGSLSLGYYWGGKLADKGVTQKGLGLIIFWSATAVFFCFLIKEELLPWLSFLIKDPRLVAVLASLILFAPASFFLGMVSPYAVKLRLKDLSDSGQRVGELYALSTLGSIVGTFLAGFYLIPFFGTNKLLLILIFSLVLMALALLSFSLRKKFFVYFFLALLFFLSLSWTEAKGMVDIDTPYQRLMVLDSEDINGRPIRLLKVGPHMAHSVIYLDGPELFSSYNKFFSLIEEYKGELKTSLMIGGAAYTFPNYYLSAFPKAEMDVSEIDAKMTELAKKYFGLEDNERLHIYHEDGRSFINHNEKKYQAIFLDAFSSYYSIPSHLTTKEAISAYYNSLSEDGLLFINLISSLEGYNGLFFQAEYRTLKEIFPEVAVFPLGEGVSSKTVQNIGILASKKPLGELFELDSTKWQEYQKKLFKGQIEANLPLLSDDYAPADYYTDKIRLD